MVGKITNVVVRMTYDWLRLLDVWVDMVDIKDFDHSASVVLPSHFCVLALAPLLSFHLPYHLSLSLSPLLSSSPTISPLFSSPTVSPLPSSPLLPSPLFSFPVISYRLLSFPRLYRSSPSIFSLLPSPLFSSPVISIPFVGILIFCPLCN